MQIHVFSVISKLFYSTGNAGGYIGMFLGYSLLSVPQLFHSAFVYFKQKKVARDVHDVF